MSSVANNATLSPTAHAMPEPTVVSAVQTAAFIVRWDQARSTSDCPTPVTNPPGMPNMKPTTVDAMIARFPPGVIPANCPFVKGVMYHKLAAQPSVVAVVHGMISSHPDLPDLSFI